MLSAPRSRVPSRAGSSGAGAASQTRAQAAQTATVPGPGSALDKSAAEQLTHPVVTANCTSSLASKTPVAPSAITAQGCSRRGSPTPTLGEQAANLYIVRGVGPRIPTRAIRYRNPKARHAMRGRGQMIRRPTVVSRCWDADFALHRRRYVSHLHENNGRRAN
jgi:hypothetical protein